MNAEEQKVRCESPSTTGYLPCLRVPVIFRALDTIWPRDCRSWQMTSLSFVRSPHI
jgi:hypothetical protein